MLSSRSQPWLHIRITLRGLKISMPRPQPRKSDSLSLGWGKLLTPLYLKAIQDDSSMSPESKQPVQPVILWVGRVLGWGLSESLTSVPFESWSWGQNSDAKQGQGPGSNSGPDSTNLGDIPANPFSAPSLGSLCCGMRLSKGSLQKFLRLWAVMLRSAFAQPEILWCLGGRMGWRWVGKTNFWKVLEGSVPVWWLLPDLSLLKDGCLRGFLGKGWGGRRPRVSWGGQAPRGLRQLSPAPSLGRPGGAPWEEGTPTKRWYLRPQLCPRFLKTFMPCSIF